MRFRQQISSATLGDEFRPTNNDLVEFGEKLNNLVFKRKINSVYNRIDSQHTRIEIISNHPEFQAIPWEYIKLPGDTPGPNSKRTIVRIVPTVGIKPPDPIKINQKVRILYVYAEPIDQEAVDWIDIKNTIENEFRARLPDSFELDVVEGADPDSLYHALENKQYNIFHFAGHGEIIDGEGRILLIDRNTYESSPYAATQLGVLLRNKNLNIVFLSACNTSVGDFSKEYTVIAKTLIRSGIPAVIANQFPIKNATASIFTREFYRELLINGDIDRATTKARIKLYSTMVVKNSDANLEYGIPTLYRHINGAKIFEIS